VCFRNGESFNGATTKESWKAPIAFCQNAGPGELQWGHDKGVVEGGKKPAKHRRRHGSFNGATTKESWKARIASPIRGRNERFNGATTKESWKAGNVRQDVR